MNNDPALPIAVEFIAGFESFRSHPYQDIGGVWTQGYGCTYHPNGSRVMPTDAPITEPQGMAWLQVMVRAVLVRVRMMVDVELSDGQIAALTSLTYNCGTGAIGRSTLLRLLNDGHFASATEQFGAWIYDDGVRIPGLVRRREAEAALFAGDRAAPSEADALNAAELSKDKA